MICYAKNVKNHATFVEGFWPEISAGGRFMKYSMSVTEFVNSCKDLFRLNDMFISAQTNKTYCIFGHKKVNQR